MKTKLIAYVEKLNGDKRYISFIETNDNDIVELTFTDDIEKSS
ncbi:hypothetical protein H3009_gp13 [Bacillus phage Harambe]|uniref:Uncharacterized protein n=1 Tax=Bacillus phage Harambe TaxID=1981931 RepID=A0A1W6JSC1_9CAUD|nr:hypothetical protein H3009_gp13 [Bacillus phage Harambe]ARM70162.1 hypothetical protein HARAMBE_13 [Bacillus phage Harambe]